MHRILVALLLLILMSVPAARAFVIPTGTNETAPADDPGWANVGNGSPNPLTVVYIGDRWVYGCGHCGPQNVNLGGTVYEYDGNPAIAPIMPGSTVNGVTYSDKGTSGLVWRLTTDPGLPSIPLWHFGAPPIGQEIVLIGNGPQRLGHHIVNGYDSWYAGNGGTKRWGTNLMSHVIPPAEYFGTTFDDGAPTPFETCAVYGDSGAIAFTKRDSTWYIIGTAAAANWAEPGSCTFGGQDITTYEAVFPHAYNSFMRGMGIASPLLPLRRP